MPRWLGTAASSSGVQVPKRSKAKGFQTGLGLPAALGLVPGRVAGTAGPDLELCSLCVPRRGGFSVPAAAVSAPLCRDRAGRMDFVMGMLAAGFGKAVTAAKLERNGRALL